MSGQDQFPSASDPEVSGGVRRKEEHSMLWKAGVIFATGFLWTFFGTFAATLLAATLLKNLLLSGVGLALTAGIMRLVTAAAIFAGLAQGALFVRSRSMVRDGEEWKIALFGNIFPLAVGGFIMFSGLRGGVLPFCRDLFYGHP